jgi:hypothetical protein
MPLPFMKNILLILVLLAFSGCTRAYVMKLNNGRQVVTASKPKLKGANYYYKDAKGQEISIPQSRVTEVLPASMASEEQSRFKSSGH